MGAQRKIDGIVLSRGSVVGPAILACAERAVAKTTGLCEEERALELTTLDRAVSEATEELRALALRVAGELGADKAEIFESHADILCDDEFRADLARLVADEGYSAASAVRAVSEANAKEMEELEDEYFRARADDFRDIGNRVIERIVKARDDAANHSSERFPSIPSIVVSRALSPGQTVSFHLPNVLAFVVSSGGANSHAAILARSLGIPAMVIPESELSLLSNGTTIALDAAGACLFIDPEPDTLSRVERSRADEIRRAERLKELLDLPSETPCGRSIGLYGNGGGMKDLSAIAEAHADGIGLFRTEFLFMEQGGFPDESTQEAYYRRALETMGDKPVIFRLLDIGADKPLPYAPHPRENNPFLGWRGIRWLIDNPDVLIGQIRAMLTASAATRRAVRVMVPMVCSPKEMSVVKNIVDRLIPETGGTAFLGMMVETPAAAMSVRLFQGLSTFISIGSNDLTQYTLAADRENELLGDLYSEFHPGVLSLMRKACADARSCGMETGICGEFAGTPEAAPYLLAMGFDELSMSARSIPSVKEAIRATRIEDARALLDEALALGSSADVRELARAFLKTRGVGA